MMASILADAISSRATFILLRMPKRSWLVGSISVANRNDSLVSNIAHGRVEEQTRHCGRIVVFRTIVKVPPV